MSADVDTINIRVKITDDGTITIDKIQGKIGRATEKISGHFDKARKGLWETFKQIAKTAGILVSTTLLFTSLSGAVRGLARDAIDFNREFTQVRTLVDESKTDVAGMEQKILAMGGALGDVTSIAKGTYQMISSGQDAESALQKIGEAAKFAQGGQVALKDAVSVGTVYLNAYGEAAGGLSHVYDVLWQTIKDGVTTAPELAHAMGRVVPIAKEVGLSIEEVSGSIAIMTQISQNTNESVTALRGILSEVIKPSGEAAKEAERLGINFSIAGVKAMGFSNWLADLVQKVKQGDGDMAKLFGRVDSLNGVFQLTRNGLQNFREEMDRMSQVTGNNQEAFEKYKQSFQGAWETMKNKLQAIFIQTILPLLKDTATWISENSENISNFVKSAINGFKSVVGIIGKFKDVLIIAGKAWLTYFAISKINSVFNAFTAGTGVINQVVVGFFNLKKYGLSTMDSLKGSFRTATGEAFSFGSAIKKIPTSVKFTVALIGAELAGRALAKLFDLISDYHDRGMAKIIQDTNKFEREAHKLTKTLIDFRRAGPEYRKALETIEKRIEQTGVRTGDLVAEQKRLLNAVKGTKEWEKYQKQLKEVGLTKYNLRRSMVDCITTYNSLAKAVGNFTKEELQAELKSIKEQGYLTDTQISKLLKLHDQYIENQKVIEEQRKAVEDLASSMGILTSQGYLEQSKKIKDLLSLYPQYKTQIASNKDTLKTWVDKIDELSKTALPGEKEALGKVREELILGYGEYNKSIVSIEDYEKGVGRALSSLFPFTAAIFENKDALYAQSLMMMGIATNNLPMLMQAWEMMGLKMSGTGKETENVDKKTNDLSDTFSALSQTINAAFDALSGFGINLGGLENIFKGVSSGLNSIGSGINAIDQAGNGFTGFLQRASGYINIFSGAVSAGVSILKGFIDLLSGKSGELEAAERRLQGLSGTTAEWSAKVEELAKQLGGADSAGRAFNMLLAEIISSSNVTIANFNQYIRKVREVVSTLEQGFASIEETQRNYGAAFEAILEKAKTLGLEGGKEMTGLILLAEEFGLKVKEIQEYIESNKKTAIEGYRQYLEAAFSDVRIGIIDEWIAFEEKVKNHQTLVDGIRGVSDSLIGLSNTTRLTQEQYTNFQLAANDAYNSLISQGFSSNEAMQVMQPMLERLAFLQQQFGYQVNESTHALINQGIEAGLISEDMKTENQLMLEGFDRIVDRLDLIAIGLGVKIPEALDSMVSGSTAAFSSIQQESEKYRRSLTATIDDIGKVRNALVGLDVTNRNVMPGNSIPVTSAARGIQFVVPPGYSDEKYGFPMYVHSGELVQVYPREETKRILSDDLSRYRKVGSDTLTTPFEIPQQTLLDFFTPPDDLFTESDRGDVEIQLNDGIQPVYMPGQSEKKVDININVNFSPIHITVDVDGDRDSTDDEELAEKITEKLKDNFRGFKEDLVQEVVQELKKEIDL